MSHNVNTSFGIIVIVRSRPPSLASTGRAEPMTCANASRPTSRRSSSLRWRNARRVVVVTQSLLVIVLCSLCSVARASGFGRSTLYHELRRTYGFGDRQPDAEHDDTVKEASETAEPEVEKPKNLLFVGARADHEELRAQFEKFPDHHDINAPLHRSGLTALKQAVILGNDTYVKTVIDLGADMNAKLHGGKAIHFNAGACGQRGSVPILKVLMSHGANAAEESDGGYQPIHLASQGWKKYCVPYVKALLEYPGVDPNARRSVGNMTTPLHEAAHKSSWEMAKVLIDAGADVNAQDADGETPLHKAIRGDHAHCAWGLMQQGADIFITNKKGVDVESLAKLLRADYDTIQMFEQHKMGMARKYDGHDEL